MRKSLAFISRLSELLLKRFQLLFQRFPLTLQQQKSRQRTRQRTRQSLRSVRDRSGTRINRLRNTEHNAVETKEYLVHLFVSLVELLELLCDVRERLYQFLITDRVDYDRIWAV